MTSVSLWPVQTQVHAGCASAPTWRDLCMDTQPVMGYMQATTVTEKYTNSPIQVNGELEIYETIHGNTVGQALIMRI